MFLSCFTVKCNCEAMDFILNSRTFGSIKKMREATLEDLKEAGLPEKVAESLQKELNKED